MEQGQLETGAADRVGGRHRGQPLLCRGILAAHDVQPRQDRDRGWVSGGARLGQAAGLVVIPVRERACHRTVKLCLLRARHLRDGRKRAQERHTGEHPE